MTGHGQLWQRQKQLPFDLATGDRAVAPEKELLGEAP